MDFNYPQINVPVAPVDSMQSMNYMPQQPQLSPQIQHISDVMQEYMNSKVQQQSGNGIAEQILANRFQPDMQDIGNSITQTAQSYARPDLFKPIDPSGAMAQRYSNELSPYTDMLRNQMSAGTQYMNMSGGGTGVLTNRMMQDNPGMSFTQAYNQVQANPALLRLGMQMQPGMGGQPSISTAAGAPQAFNTMENAKKAGEQAGVLQYAAPISAASTGAKEQQELNYAGPKAIAAQTVAANTELQDVQSKHDQLTASIDKLKGIFSGPNALPEGMMPAARPALAHLPSLGMSSMQPYQSAQQQVEQLKADQILPAIKEFLKGTGQVRVFEGDLLQKLNQVGLGNTNQTNVDVLDGFQTMIDQELQASQAKAQMLRQGGSKTVKPSLSPYKGIPNPPTPDQINQQMQGATHRYNPATGTVDPIQ